MEARCSVERTAVCGCVRHGAGLHRRCTNRIRLLRVMLFAALAATPLLCLAQSGASPSLAMQAPEPGSQYYPAEIAASGAQGTALVKARIAEDGGLIEPAIEQSSRSMQLDDLAIAFVGTMKVKVKEGATLPGSVVVPVAFERDTIFTLPGKTCGEFNADLAYARTLSPVVTAGQVRAFRLTTGMMMLMPGVPRDKQLAVLRNLKSLPPLVEAKCAASPDAKFVETVTGVVPTH